MIRQPSGYTIQLTHPHTQQDTGTFQQLFRQAIYFATVVSLIFVCSVSRAEPLSVGTIERPPFSYYDDNDKLIGFSVELWEEIADRAQLEYLWTPHNQLSGMIESATRGDTDLAIANISITSAREKDADFSLPIFSSGMAIAIKKDSGNHMLALIWQSGIFLYLGGAILLVFVVANIVWFFERGIEDARHDYFRDDYIGGVWDAFWWAFVILTMGGFEKEVPHKIINRLMAIVWIVVSLFFISTLTAKITTSLTVAELQTGIESYSDLAGKKVGVTRGSSHQKFLVEHNIQTIEYDTLDVLYQELQLGRLDAIVADFPILSYYSTHKGSNWMILSGNAFNPEDFGILFPDDSENIEIVNNVLLRIREDSVYDKIYKKYFGTP